MKTTARVHTAHKPPPDGFKLTETSHRCPVEWGVVGGGGGGKPARIESPGTRKTILWTEVGKVFSRNVVLKLN